MKRNCNGLLLALTFLSVPLLTGCLEKNLFDRDFTTLSPEPNLLDYSTTRSVQITMNYPDMPQGYSAVFSLYDEMPLELSADGQLSLKEDLEPVGGGISVSGGFNMEKIFPRFVNKLYAYSEHLFAPRLMVADVVADAAVFQVVDPYELLSQDTRSAAPATRSASNGKIDLYLGANVTSPDVDANGCPNYFDHEMQTNISADILARIEKMFPAHNAANTEFYTDASIYIQQDANVWVSLLFSEGVFRNHMAYLCYDGPKSDLATLTTAQREELKLISILPLARQDVVGRGNYVKLKYYDKNTGEFSETFPAGTTIVWVLYPVSQHGGYMGNTFYSYPGWNPEGNANDRNHTIYFNAGTEQLPFVCFGFEDMKNDGSWGWLDRDCNDLIFNVQLDPIDALDPPPVIEVPDVDLTTFQTFKGFFSFEDYWPMWFDYDMNDILVKYNSQATYFKKAGETETYVTELNDRFAIVFSGANFLNQLSLKMEFSPSLVESIYLEEKGPVVTAARKKVTPIADGSGFIIDLCLDGAGAVIDRYNYEAEPHTYYLSLKFKEKAMTQSDFENYCAPYNPFATAQYRISNAGGPEVHLMGMRPTQRLNYELLGALDDRSIPEQGLYYIGSKDKIYPFSLHVAGVNEFFIPQEHQEIGVTYPKFIDWVNSGMVDHNDWYMYPDKTVRDRFPVWDIIDAGNISIFR